MASFSFVHAADLHLGSPMRGLSLRDDIVSAQFARAIRAAVSALVDRTLTSGARFLVIAGDVYDGAWKDASVGLFFNREVARLDRAGVPVFVLRGNHDAQSIVTQSVPLPENVRSFSARSPQTHVLEDLNVALHGQSFADRRAGDNLARGYPAPRPHCFNIGVLHTSLTGRPPHADYAPCSIEDLVSKGYDYWALGHVHQFERVHMDPPIVYPGNLQGRNIRETGAKGAVLVRVEDGHVESIERIVVDQARWMRLDLDITPFDTVSDMHVALKAQADMMVQDADARPVAVRVTLSGRSPLHDELLADRGQVCAELEAVLHHVGSDFWLEKVKLDVTPPSRTDGEPASTLDLDYLIGAAVEDPTFEDAYTAALDILKAKMPPGLLDPDEPFGESAVALIDEARAVLAARLREKGS